MGRLKKVSAFIVGAATVALLGAAPVLAQGGSQSFTLGGDAFSSGDSVTVTETSNDAYAAGGTVTISGPVQGDVLAAGGTIDVNGTVGGSVRAAGGNLSLRSDVARNVNLAGGSITVDSSAHVRGNLITGGGTVTVNGPVDGTAMLGGGTVVVNGTINGDVKIYSDSIRLGHSAVIKGNLEYYSKNDLTRENGAQVQGSVTHKQPAQKHHPARDVGRVFGLIAFLMTVLTGLVFFALFPAFGAAVSATITRKPWASIGLGFLLIITVPIAAVLMMITILGIPLALIALAVYAITLYLAKIFVMLWAGLALIGLAGEKMAWPIAFLLGAVIYSLLHLIPVVNVLLVLVTLTLGTGAIALTAFGRYRTKAA